MNFIQEKLIKQSDKDFKLNMFKYSKRNNIYFKNGIVKYIRYK